MSIYKGSELILDVPKLFMKNYIDDLLDTRELHTLLNEEFVADLLSSQAMNAAYIDTSYLDESELAVLRQLTEKIMNAYRSGEKFVSMSYSEMFMQNFDRIITALSH